MRVQDGCRPDLLRKEGSPPDVLAEATRFVVEGSSILDLGCGLGPLIEHLHPLRIAYHGIDFCPESIASCRARYGSRPEIRLEIGDVTTLDFGRSVYDVVALLDLVHLPDLDPARLLRKSHEALKAGGLLLVSGPSKAELQSPGDPRPTSRQRARGYTCSAEGMEALAKLLGFHRTLMARSDLQNGQAYLVVVQK